MPLARTNAFGLVLYPGTSSPGRVAFEPWASKGNNLTIMDYAEGRASQEAGRITAQELLELERNVMPGSGTCGAIGGASVSSTTWSSTVSVDWMRRWSRSCTSSPRSTAVSSNAT